MKQITEDNYLKYENYKEQFKRLNRALSNGFNLEAMFIEYAIIEDRTESILRHAGLWDACCKKTKNGIPSIDSKLKYIQKHAENKKHLLHRYFSDDLLCQILTWKECRNKLIHALLKQQIEHNEIEQLALQGYEYTKLIRNRSSCYNRAQEKINLKEAAKSDS